MARAKGGPGLRPAAFIRATGLQQREPLAGERSADEIRTTVAGLKESCFLSHCFN